jgi:cell shape-determining protein MreD
MKISKKHTKIWWILGLSLVFIPAWLLFFYLASLALYDLLLDTLIVALALGILSYLLSKALHVETMQEALVACVVWASLLFLVELLITLLNGTTGVIFSTWTTYVVYVAIALAPWLVFLTAHPRVHRQETVP